MAPLVEHTEYVYNKDKWGRRFNLEDEDDLNEETINRFIMLYIKFYEKKGYDDMVLWEYFKQDFEGWTKDMFLIANGNLFWDLRDHLQAYGCWVRKDSKSITGNIEKLLKEKEQHE